ncbi:MAG: DUF72 domain-containing protein [Actinobacteria bacterium]|nr:DUF72 domain-containing protein [Actinomycetota bacterium]
MGIAVGTSSWTDPTLTKESDFYPRRSMSAEERLRHYASIFPAVEVDGTYYAPPTARTAQLWAERTPAGFRMNVKAYALFTQHPTRPSTLWEDVHDDLPDEHRDKRSTYLAHLPDPAVDRAWEHFRAALEPLQAAGKLAAVVFQFPPWFTARRDNRAYLAELAHRLPGHQLAVEFRHRSWLDGDDDRRRTLRLLEEHGLAFVCVDGPQGFDSSVPPLVAATADLAIVRFHGHNRETWEAKGISAAERFRYLYSEDELAAWVEPIRGLAGATSETHALMNNCYRDYGVRNARQLGQLLGEGLQAGAA